MKKLFWALIEYISLILASILLVAFIFIGAGFLWLSDNHVKTLPKSIPQIFSKLYSSDFLTTHLESLNIQLNKNYNLDLTTKLFVINNHNKNILETDAVSIKIYINKIKKLKIPIDINIDQLRIHTSNLDVSESFISKNFNKFLYNRNSSIFKLNILSIKNSIIELGNRQYRLDHEFNFNSPLNAITIPCITNPQESIHITQNETSLLNDLTTDITIENIPINTVNHLIPKIYKPQIFNKSTSLLTLNILNIKESKELKLKIFNTSKDKVLDKINIVITKTNNTPCNIDFLLKLQNDQGYFKGSSQVFLNENKLFNSDIKFILNMESKNINLKHLDNLWPESLEYEIREWLVSSMTEGIIRKASIKLSISDVNNMSKDDLDVDLTFDDLNLNYYNNHKPISKASGNAHFDLEQVKINVNKGYIENAILEDSTVTIKFLEPDIPLVIETSSHGHLRNFMHFLQTDPDANVFYKNIDVNKIDGIVNLKCKITIPLEKDISIENSEILANGQFSNVSIPINTNINLKSKLLDLKIKDHSILVTGNTTINNQSGALTWKNNLLDSESFDNHILLTATITNSSHLLESLQNKIIIKDGKILGKLLYTNKDNSEKITFQLNMEPAKVIIPELGLEKKINNDAELNVEIESTNQSNWKSNNISFISKSEKINIKSNIEASNDFSKITAWTADIILPNSDLNFIFRQTDTKESLSLRSSSLDLSHTNLFEILNSFIKDKKPSQKDTSISLQLDNIKMKNKIFFRKILGNFDCINNFCSNSGLSMTMNDDTQLKVTLLNKNNKNFWLIKTNNAAYFLQGLDIYNNINGGELTIKIQNVAPAESRDSAFAGNFKMTNFKAIKTPLLAKLIILSPFSSLIKTIEGQDLLPFKIMEGNFTTQGQSMKIEHSYARGQNLIATLKGNINYKNDTINLSGKIIPKSLVNSIFNKQKEQEQGKALLFTQYRIVGKITEPKVKVHPIGAVLSILTRIPLGIL